MPDIYRELENLADSEMYPFHMPGHKRNVESTPLKGAFRCDITEIDDFDNLHDEEGIILEAEQRACRLYGADETYFLINGSTAGVLSAVSAAVKRNGRILASRGSHRSFYHAAYLRNLDVEYLPARVIDEYGIPDCVRPEDVEAAISAAKEKPEAVFITSPTYEGKCADVPGIVRVCHRYGIPLIVDAAHGAHFGFGEGVPASAVQQGADIVVHSVHKTLPSMTQTALIHINGNLVDKSELKKFLRIYQSSSPSYVLMSSIDLCMKELEESGAEYLSKLVKYREKIQIETAKCSKIKIPGTDELEDPAKVLIYVRDGAMTGKQLYDILREEYALQLEMAGESYALAIITGWDLEEGIDRLIKALIEIDKKLTSEKSVTKDSGSIYAMLPRKVFSIGEAWDMEKEVVALDQAQGRISADFVNLYPPGIPLVVPGEEISRELIDEIKELCRKNLNLQGLVTGDTEDKHGIIETEAKGLLCVKLK